MKAGSLIFNFDYRLVSYASRYFNSLSPPYEAYFHTCNVSEGMYRVRLPRIKTKFIRIRIFYLSHRYPAIVQQKLASVPDVGRTYIMDTIRIYVGPIVNNVNILHRAVHTAKPSRAQCEPSF